MSRATWGCLGQPRDMLSLSVRTGPTQKDMLTASGARDRPGRICLFFPGHASLSAGHVHFLCHWVGWRPVRGPCPFFPRGMLIFRGKEWADEGDVQASAHVPCNPGLPGPAAGHARSFWSAAGQPGDMLIRSQAPRSHPGGHVHSSWLGPDIWGICPGLRVSGGHVQRAGGDPPSQIKPARGHCVLPTAEDGTQ